MGSFGRQSVIRNKHLPSGTALTRDVTGAAVYCRQGGFFLVLRLFVLFSILATLLALQSIFSLQGGYRFLRFVRRSLRKPPGDYLPPVALVIPCKGLSQDFEVNLTRFLTQDYPAYELVFVVASQEDPAHRCILESLRTWAGDFPELHATSVVIAGRSEVRGEKVNNLLHGLTAVSRRAEVLVFADADARPKPDWLRCLVSPLADRSVTVSTGFRWYLPGFSFASQVRAAWDTSIATMLGEHDHNFAWGGSMALRVETFERLRLAERYWAHTVSDDYAVTRAVRDAGGRIRFEPRCLLASREESSFRDFVRWANRQIIITRVYAASLWTVGLASHGLYCVTFLLGLLLLARSGSSMPERLAIIAALLFIVSLGLAKGYIRYVAAGELFPEEKTTLRSYGPRYWQLAPVVPWLMLYNFVIASFSRRIEWRGTHYVLKSRNEVAVVRRDKT
jgi:cellulose synthase/poly-beta-1,6-N-acetylglucosamine synthase-like glycosyltransferase